MQFRNPPRAEMEALLRQSHTIAVVGLSENATRTSHGVSESMRDYGYRIIPVNPVIRSALGERSVPDLDHVADALRPGERVDIVNVFRRPEHVAHVVDRCIALGFPALWLQEGVIDESAAERARAAGIFVVMDECIYKIRAAM